MKKSLSVYVLLVVGFALPWLLLVFLWAVPPATVSSPFLDPADQTHRAMQELDSPETDDEVTGNLFFGELSFFFQCTLGWEYILFFIPVNWLFPGTCICNERVLRNRISSILFFDLVAICRDTNVKVTGNPIDISGKAFVMFCQDRGDLPVTCTLSKEAGTGPMFSGAANGMGISDLKLGPATDGIFDLTGNGRAVVRRVDITGSRGAIRVTGVDADLLMENAVLLQNAAPGENGGAMRVSGATKVILTGLQFLDNSAGEGGALAVTNGGRVTIQTTGFKGNSAAAADDIYIQDAASSVTCLPTGSGVQFCGGIANAFDADSASRTDCDTVGTTSGGIC
jgi:hypothetical protein